MSTDSLFRRSIQPLRIFLNSFGLLYHPLAGCSRWKNLLKSCWTLFWLLLNLHVFLFVLVKRALPVLVASNHLFLLEMNSFMAFFAHINPATMGLLCHTKLVLILRDGHSLIRKALRDVIPINPSDHFRLRRSSVLVVACIILSIFFNSGFLIVWDYWNPTNNPSNILTVRTVYKHLGLVSHSVFGWSCACLYVVLARHLVLYYHESVMKGWKRTASDNENDILLMLIKFHKLDSFARLLIKDFAPILLVLCCSSLFSCLTASYFMILSYFDGKLIYLAYTWDTFQIMEGFGRLILICWTTDQLVQTPALKGIEELRKWRDCRENSQAIRTKITWIIVELGHWKNHDTVFIGVRLLGLLPLSSHLILQTIETVFCFLVVLYQFKIAQGF